MVVTASAKVVRVSSGSLCSGSRDGRRRRVSRLLAVCVAACTALFALRVASSISGTGAAGLAQGFLSPAAPAWASSGTLLAASPFIGAWQSGSPAVARVKLASAAAEAVDAFVSQNKVIVFSKTYCPFCKKAKAALTEAGATFTTVELDEREDGDAIQDALLAKTGGRSVPRVFIGGKFIGGGDDTVRLQSTGELASLLAAA
eukprot:TRINITY_DN2225_c0_g1_i4.p1 TRINITY_DN2225_c0_g1~~TRINITY_DN2225_c0_g1_i4.p1  ORF type:complete len:223 (-),score=40.07 TRINITY_DN2225_c0_g1_i4:20-625(-)